MEWRKGVFIPTTIGNFAKDCGTCGEPRTLFKERYEKHSDDGHYKKVIVHFGLDFETGEYRSTAIIEDEESPFTGVAEIWNPLIPATAEARATKQAENVFIGLNLHDSVVNEPIEIHYSSDEFETELKAVAAMWKATAEKLHNG